MKKRRKRFQLVYRSGEHVRAKDKVLVYPQRPAVVEAVLKPGTALACNYSVEKEGGFILRFNDGNLEVWMRAEDEIELVARGRTRGVPPKGE